MVKKILVLAMLAAFMPSVRADFKADKKKQISSLNAEQKRVNKALGFINKKKFTDQGVELLKKRNEYLMTALQRTKNATSPIKLDLGLVAAFAVYPSVPFANIPVGTNLAADQLTNAYANEKKRLSDAVRADESQAATGGAGINGMSKEQIEAALQAAREKAVTYANAQVDIIKKAKGAELLGARAFGFNLQKSLENDYSDHNSDTLFHKLQKKLPGTANALRKSYIKFLVDEQLFKFNMLLKTGSSFIKYLKHQKVAAIGMAVQGWSKQNIDSKRRQLEGQIVAIKGAKASVYRAKVKFKTRLTEIKKTNNSGKNEEIVAAATSPVSNPYTSIIQQYHGERGYKAH